VLQCTSQRCNDILFEIFGEKKQFHTMFLDSAVSPRYQRFQEVGWNYILLARAQKLGYMIIVVVA
jgi:hypothetical protein